MKNGCISLLLFIAGIFAKNQVILSEKCEINEDCVVGFECKMYKCELNYLPDNANGPSNLALTSHLLLNQLNIFTKGVFSNLEDASKAVTESNQQITLLNNLQRKNDPDSAELKDNLDNSVDSFLKRLNDTLTDGSKEFDAFATKTKTDFNQFKSEIKQKMNKPKEEKVPSKPTITETESLEDKDSKYDSDLEPKYDTHMGTDTQNSTLKKRNTAGTETHEFDWSQYNTDTENDKTNEAKTEDLFAIPLAENNNLLKSFIENEENVDVEELKKTLLENSNNVTDRAIMIAEEASKLADILAIRLKTTAANLKQAAIELKRKTSNISSNVENDEPSDKQEVEDDEAAETSVKMGKYFAIALAVSLVIFGVIAFCCNGSREGYSRIS